MNTQPEALRLAKELITAVRQSFEDEQVILVARWFVEDSAAELRRLHEANQAMLEALKDAATSLETVGRLAGKSDYLGEDGERIPTFMKHYDEVRGYAKSRATVARAAIAKGETK